MNASETISPGERQPLSKDDRYELAALAQNQQRLNSPRHLIMLGIVLVAIALVVLLISWRSKAGALKDNADLAFKLKNISTLITDIRVLEAAQQDNQQDDLFKPIPDLRSRLKGYGTQSGVPSLPSVPAQAIQPMGDAQLISYTYTVIDPSIENMLDWITLSTEQVPGLFVNELELKPGKQDWTMTVKLSRYQRKE
tara:strand:- start:92333 stop:92920 length:588 start_codon:yes stop_codon:yes gene_type:complete